MKIGAGGAIPGNTEKKKKGKKKSAKGDPNFTNSGGKKGKPD